MAESPRTSPLLETAKSLAPIVEEHASQGERERRLPQPTMQAYSDSKIQRCFRDVHTITQNFVVAPPTYELFGQIMMGVEADTLLL